MTAILRPAMLLLALLAPPPLAAQQSADRDAVCMAVDSLLVPVVLGGLRRVVTSPGQEAAATRELHRLPQTSASQVTFVTDDAVCANAARAYAAILGKDAPARPSGSVYVFRIDDVYMVTDTAQRVGEYLITMTLNERFRLLARYLK